jgi:hypothetical protein
MSFGEECRRVAVAVDSLLDQIGQLTEMEPLESSADCVSFDTVF